MKSVVVFVFGLTTFLASVLLFSAEPMIGKRVLPFFGGTPAVWNTCLVYFQLVVVGGYAYAGAPLMFRGHGRRFVSLTYLVPTALLLAAACATPPLTPDRIVVNPGTDPATALFWTLLVSRTLPLVMVAATAPLAQSWFSLTDHARAHDPYFLYAASNAGSLMALLAYPFVIEPTLSLDVQSRVWSAGSVVLSILILSCALIARRTIRPDVQPDRNAEAAPPVALTAPLTLRAVLLWLAFVFIPSMWLMGVTTYLTTDLAPMPLLWVVPLALYLLSFIVAFAGPDSSAVRLAGRTLPIGVLLLVLVLSAGFVHAFWIPLHLLTFLAGAVACHGVLARHRPRASDLSTFYLVIAAGGLLGGVFNAVIAPLLFNRIVEYPLAIVAGCAVAGWAERPARIAGRRARLSGLWLPVAVYTLVALLVTRQVSVADSIPGVAGMMLASGLVFYTLVTSRQRPVRFALAAGAVLAASGLTQGPSGRLLHIERNFFGVLRVTEDSGRTVHRLFHGSTLHGQQRLDPALAREPSTYFTRSGPIGQLFAALGPGLGRPGTRIAIVGLGAGTLAAYAQPDQRWTFYEIDPAVERIARDVRYFTYLRDCRAEALDVVLGDARLRLRDAPDRAYRLIVLDAFSSDSLPVHLVTREAIRLYRSRLAGNGVLAFNLTNRYLDLDPLVGRQAEDAGLVCRIGYDTLVSEDERRAGKQPSIWAVMAASDRDLGALADDPRWQRPRTRLDARPWTDDDSDLTRYFRWTPVKTTAVERSDLGAAQSLFQKPL